MCIVLHTYTYTYTYIDNYNRQISPAAGSAGQFTHETNETACFLFLIATVLKMIATVH